MTWKPTTPEFSDPAVPGEWDTPQRASVKRMCLNEASTKQIQESTGVPERTQSQIMKQSTQRPGKHHSGQKSRIDHDIIDKIIKTLKGHYN